jgi:DNA polymerase IIIc chi subunit
MLDPSSVHEQQEEAAKQFLKFNALRQGSFLPHNTKRNSGKSKQQQPTAIEQTKHCSGHGTRRFEIDPPQWLRAQRTCVYS